MAGDGGGGHAIKALPNGLLSISVDAPHISLSAPTTPTETSCPSQGSIKSTSRSHSPAPTEVQQDTPKQRATAVRQQSAYHRRRTRSESSRRGCEEWGSMFWYIITEPLCSSNTFFANPYTGVCQWEVEAGSIVLPPNPAGEWWQLRDDKTHRLYFYHTQTGKSVWERPDTGLVIPLVAVQESIECANASFDSTMLRTRRAIRFSDASSSVTTAVPTREQVLTQRARSSILDQDRLWVAQALASSPTPHSLPSRQTHRPSIHVQGTQVLPSLGTLPHTTYAKSTSLGNLRSTQQNGPNALAPGIAVSLSRSYESHRKTVRRQRDPEKRIALLTPTNPFSYGDAASSSEVFSQTQTQMAPEQQWYFFAACHFSTQRRRIFPFLRRKVSMSSLVKWQKSSLQAPLFAIENAELRKEALQMFRALQTWMGDRDPISEWQIRPYSPLFQRKSRGGDSSSTSSSSRTQNSVDAGIEVEQSSWMQRLMHSSVLRDEMYAQTIKQLTENSSQASLVKGCKWLNALFSTAPPDPTDKMYAPVHAFFKQHIDSIDRPHSPSIAH